MPSLANWLQDQRFTSTNFLVLEAGKSPCVADRSGAARIADQALTADDLQAVLRLVPEPDRTQLLNRSIPNYRIRCDGAGEFELTVYAGANGPRLALRRLGAESAGTNAQAGPAVAASPQIAQLSAVVTPTAGAHVKSAPEMQKLFAAQLAMKASDMHLCSGTRPMVRLDGEMAPLEAAGYGEVLTPADAERLLWEIMPEKNREEFQQRHDTDFAYEFGSEARFRCNIFMDRKGMGGVFRVIPSKILTAEELGLSEHILKLCFLTKGLVVVTGPTGSGKSTTLCAMVDYINRNRRDHIITIEDPIEFVHENKGCLINQREIFNHTSSFKDALRAALREDPDIVLVGEMRDLETVSIAIETAETGHLVFGTLHTNTAPSTVDRIIDQFPADRQAQVRIMLCESLKAVIAQTLCKKIGGGRIAALETLLVDHAIANLIREGKTMQIPSAMQTSKGKGNITLNDSLFDLVKRKLVEPREAYLRAVDKQGFETYLRREPGIDLSWLRPEGMAAAAKR